MSSTSNEEKQNPLLHVQCAYKGCEVVGKVTRADGSTSFECYSIDGPLFYCEAHRRVMCNKHEKYKLLSNQQYIGASFSALLFAGLFSSVFLFLFLFCLFSFFHRRAFNAGQSLLKLCKSCYRCALHEDVKSYQKVLQSMQQALHLRLDYQNKLRSDITSGGHEHYDGELAASIETLKRELPMFELMKKTSYLQSRQTAQLCSDCKSGDLEWQKRRQQSLNGELALLLSKRRSLPRDVTSSQILGISRTKHLEEVNDVVFDLDRCKLNRQLKAVLQTKENLFNYSAYLQAWRSTPLNCFGSHMPVDIQYAPDDLEYDNYENSEQ